MLSRKSSLIAILIVVSVGTILLFQNCGVQKPHIEDMSSLSIGFSHTPTPSSCVSCHGSERPTTALTLAVDAKSNLFFHIGQYNGQNDCVLCHAQNQTDVGKTWKNGIFNHKTDLNVTVSNCATCHLGNMPFGPIGAAQFNHSAIGAQDCSVCHKNVGANWSTTAFSHTPTPNTCISCHSSDRPNATAYIPSNPAQPNLNLYVHATQYNGAADCLSCHTSVTANIGVKWAGGFFNHKSDKGVTVATCLDCHTGTRPANHTAATGQLGDCVSCHTNAGVNWNSSAGAVPATVTMVPPTGTNLATITIKHPTLQTGMSCTTCHSNYNATNSIKGFDHTEGLVLANNGTKVANSCYYCHFSPSKVIDSAALPNNSSRTYASGKIVIRPNSHHGETLTNSSSCLSCHSASSPPAWSSDTKTWTTGGKWNGG